MSNMNQYLVQWTLDGIFDGGVRLMASSHDEAKDKALEAFSKDGSITNLRSRKLTQDEIDEIAKRNDSWHVESVDDEEPDPGYDPRDAIMNAWDGERDQPAI
jgi:hypothetical protein